MPSCTHGRNRSSDQDELTDNIDHCEDDDGIVATQILICNNRAKDRRDIAPLKSDALDKEKKEAERNARDNRGVQNWKKLERPVPPC